MKLTPEQEEALVIKFTPYIWNVVWRFCRRRQKGHQTLQDLFQECMMVFVKHIRNVESEEEILPKMPIRDMTHNMCLFITEVGPCVSYPNSTFYFRKAMTSAPSWIHLDALAECEEDLQAELSLNTVECETDFSGFKDFLTPFQTKIVEMKKSGMNNREVAKALGISEPTVSAGLSRIWKKYKEFISTAA